MELVAEVEPPNDLTFRVLLPQVRRISGEGQDARDALSEMGLPVMAAERLQLSFYSDAFRAPLDEDLGAYERVAAELLREI